MAVSLSLVLLGGLSSRYILGEQELRHGGALAISVAEKIAPILARGDLIRLEVSLQQLLARHHLLQLSVFDIEGRALGVAGAAAAGIGNLYRSPITIEGNIAGESVIIMAPDASLQELQKMSLGLFSLALLLSLLAAVLGSIWGQSLSQRLLKAIGLLALSEAPVDNEASRDELTQLDTAISRLPLDLLKPTASSTASSGDYQQASLLYISLTSLSTHVETLDEASLLNSTELQRRLISGAAELYGGKLSVARQFGLLVSFGEAHNSGEPAYRAVAAAWLIKQVAASMSIELPLRIKLSLACGFSACGVGSSADIYPDLYNQHLIDELESVTSDKPENILLTDAVAEDMQVSSRCRLSNGAGQWSLANFTEPYHDLLERQQELLLRELRRD